MDLKLVLFSEAQLQGPETFDSAGSKEFQKLLCFSSILAWSSDCRLSLAPKHSNLRLPRSPGILGQGPLNNWWEDDWQDKRITYTVLNHTLECFACFTQQLYTTRNIFVLRVWMNSCAFAGLQVTVCSCGFAKTLRDSRLFETLLLLDSMLCIRECFPSFFGQVSCFWSCFFTAISQSPTPILRSARLCSNYHWQWRHCYSSTCSSSCLKKKKLQQRYLHVHLHLHLLLSCIPPPKKKMNKSKCPLGCDLALLTACSDDWREAILVLSKNGEVNVRREADNSRNQWTPKVQLSKLLKHTLQFVSSAWKAIFAGLSETRNQTSSISVILHYRNKWLVRQDDFHIVWSSEAIQTTLSWTVA